MIYIRLHDEKEKIIHCSHIFVTTDKKQYSIYENHEDLILFLKNSTIQCFDKAILVDVFYDHEGIIHIQNNTVTSIS